MREHRAVSPTGVLPGRSAGRGLLGLILTALVVIGLLSTAAIAQQGRTANPDTVPEYSLEPAGDRARGPAVPADVAPSSGEPPIGAASAHRSAASAASAAEGASGSAPETPAATEPPAATETATANPDAAAAGAAASDTTAAEAAALLELLRNEDIRQRLIDELEKIAPPSSGAEGEAQAANGAAPVAPPGTDAVASEAQSGQPVPIGTRIAEWIMRVVDQTAIQMERAWNGLTATIRRLEGFQRTDFERLNQILNEIGVAVLASIGTLYLLRLLARPLIRRVSHFVDPMRLVRSSIIALGILAGHALIILLAFFVGLVISLFVFPPLRDLTIYQTLFLQAFVVAEAGALAVRLLMSPASPQLRVVPLSDRAARYWTLQLGSIVRVLAYTELLIQPIVVDTVSVFTGRATSVAVFVLTLGWAMTLVMLHRRAPSAYLETVANAQGKDVTISILASVMRYWHLLMLPYFAALFVSAITSAGAVKPILLATLQIIVGFAAGAFAITWITRITRDGIKLPGRISETLPMLERRIDAFVPSFLRAFRFVIFILWLGYSLHILNLLDIWAWTESALGIDIASTLISVTLIVICVFAFWLALMSWIDYRLTPRAGRVVTSRERTLLTLLRNASSIAIIVVGTMFTLSEVGINIAPLIASAGVLGLAIGFGAQKMVQDIITGVFIQFENAINVGDYIEAGGKGGTVEKLTIRSVSLRDVHGVLHLVPFSSVDSVSNYMKGFGYHVADMGIAYREDVDEAKALMLQAFADLKDDPQEGTHILGDLEWFGVQSLGDSAVVLRARIKTRPGWQWAAGRAYNERVKKAFDAAGVEIPFPQTTMWFGEAKSGPAPVARVEVSERRGQKAEPEREAHGPEAPEPPPESTKALPHGE